ncbi:MAG TPA: biotin/lipoyl-containing protein, partial [Burkholderiales bacterium]|nr:biotin/lipoyl-containing protein [Burkholderiales bacterium]
MSNVIEVTVPDIGDFKNIPVIEVFVKPGDTVKAEESLMTLESDKATMDVPSPASGVVKSIMIKTGDKVSKGTPVLVLEAAAAATSKETKAEASTPSAEATPAKAAARASAPATPAPAAVAVPSAKVPTLVDEAQHRMAHASPSVRQFARELGVDLSRVKGGGPKDRILREDVQAFVKGELARPRDAAGSGLGFNLPPMPQIDFSKFGSVEVKPL